MPSSPSDILRRAVTIAVVGASRDPSKPGASVPRTMQRYGFRIIPVNPSVDRLFGERIYHSLAEITEPVDIVNVFRPAAEAPALANQAVALHARALWLQTGIRSAEAHRIAEAGGLDFVED